MCTACPAKMKQQHPENVVRETWGIQLGHAGETDAEQTSPFSVSHHFVSLVLQAGVEPEKGHKLFVLRNSSILHILTFDVNSEAPHLIQYTSAP